MYPDLSLHDGHYSLHAQYASHCPILIFRWRPHLWFSVHWQSWRHPKSQARRTHRVRSWSLRSYACVFYYLLLVNWTANDHFGIFLTTKDVGHVKFLEKCRELGTYIIVGLHSDEVRSKHLPLHKLYPLFYFALWFPSVWVKIAQKCFVYAGGLSVGLIFMPV